LEGNSTTTRVAIFSPSQAGEYQVELQCGGVNVAICGNRVFASNASPPVKFVFTGAAPADLAGFMAKFAQATASAAKIDLSQVVGVTVTNTRRRAGFETTATILGSTTQNDPNTVAQSVVTAAVNGGLNTQLQALGQPTASSVAFNGNTQNTPVLTTAIPITPAPNAASSLSSSVMTIAAMLFAALLAFF
jgi:hypothetical protein